MRTELLIGGSWTAGDRERLPVENPATGDVVAEVALATIDDVGAAVDAAAGRGADALEAMPVFERARLLHRVADGIDARADELARLLSAESGKPLAGEAMGEIEESADIFRWSAEEAKRLETPSFGT